MRPTPINFYGSTHIAAIGVRSALLMAVWLVLAEGDTYRWWFGLLACVVAAGASLPLLPPEGMRVRLLPLMRFVPYFLWASLLGGVDVGWRVVGRRMEIRPTFVTTSLALPPGPARLWLIALISLMPGTLSCHLKADSLKLHVLDEAQDVEAVVRRLEWHLHRIFARPKQGE